MDKLAQFRAMHQQDELLFLPNAWDVLSALVLEQCGFKAVGTTSWGVANAMGCKDGQNIQFSELLALLNKMVSSVSIPVTVDIESGYSDDINTVADNVLKIAELGGAGINIEDSLKNSKGLVEVPTQTKCIEKIRAKLDNNGYADFFINARLDTYFLLDKPLQGTKSRAKHYCESGANGIFVPGLSQADEIKQVVASIDAPLNVMSLPNLTDVGVLNRLGVKRFSIGNALSDATTAFIEQQASQLMANQDTSHLYDRKKTTTRFS